jgi:hypothetical protein
MQYVDPEDAGFDTDKLNAVKDKFIENGGSSLMVIREGYVVSYIGPVDRCYRQTSVRKSYLNALYGIFVDRGDIDLNASLASLNIDDTPPLNDNHDENRSFMKENIFDNLMKRMIEAGLQYYNYYKAVRAYIIRQHTHRSGWRSNCPKEAVMPRAPIGFTTTGILTPWPRFLNSKHIGICLKRFRNI